MPQGPASLPNVSQETPCQEIPPLLWPQIHIQAGRALCWAGRRRVGGLQRDGVTKTQQSNAHFHYTCMKHTPKIKRTPFFVGIEGEECTPWILPLRRKFPPPPKIPFSFLIFISLNLMTLQLTEKLQVILQLVSIRVKKWKRVTSRTFQLFCLWSLQRSLWRHISSLFIIIMIE